MTDSGGQKLAYVYFEDEPGRRSAAKLLSKDEARIANDGHDTRAIQAYLGHRSIVSTVRYTALTPNRFKNFWKD